MLSAAGGFNAVRCQRKDVSGTRWPDGAEHGSIAGKKAHILGRWRHEMTFFDLSPSAEVTGQEGHVKSAIVLPAECL